MPATLEEILGKNGAIARRLGERYEFRPQQMEMASSVARAFKEGHHLLVEAGTGVGKSFAYLLPAIDYAVRTKKRVVISTHTISLQEQLIDKDIPLLRAVYPDEFTAVLVKGRGNYLCQRRLEQARGRQLMLFENDKQLESLRAIEQWAAKTTDGSLADLPAVPDTGVWDRVCAEAGNCMGKQCKFYADCFWQTAKRRMQTGNILVVNHALFFSDLALRMAGVSYLPKYDVAILDEAHTVEDVAGSHFGLNISESGLRYQLRLLYDVRKGKGMLNSHGACANDAIRDVIEVHDRLDDFFEGCVQWQQASGRSNGRIREPNIVTNDVSPKLRDLSLHLLAMVQKLAKDEEIAEITAAADKISILAQTLDGLICQTVENAVYWMETSSTAYQRKVSLHAAPVDVAQGLRTHLFEQVKSVVMTSATLCTGVVKHGEKPVQRRETRAVLPASRSDGVNAGRDTGVPPVPGAPSDGSLLVRNGAYLPHWEKKHAVYAITFRLADSLPQLILKTWLAERDELVSAARDENRPLDSDERKRLDELHSERVEKYLDSGFGTCWLGRDDIAALVAGALRHFDGTRYDLLAWCVMPNHVHVIVRPYEGEAIPKILHSWKSHSAQEANKLLGRTGDFWQPEYYDHLVRDEDDLRHAVQYVLDNPKKAGLNNWNWRGKSDAILREILNSPPEESIPHGRDARVTSTGSNSVTANRDKGVPPMPEVPREQSPGPFAYIKSRLGVSDCETLQLGSPFDYAKQATLYVETDLPEPSDTLRFLPAACEKIIHYLGKTNGGAFVLFTSYSMLRDAANRLKKTLDQMNLPLLVQGHDAPRKVLLERFRTTPNSVLFGTSSFWQGIDVQGDALRNVIIVKLPFAVPDEPVIEARLDAIKRTGGNPFMEYSVPEAIIKLKQGFGRLIRSKTDTGIVVILDSRVKTKRYGKLFLGALPECKTGA